MITISDALPVQFYLNGIPTFNEKLEPGIEHQCFFQPFNADDKIKAQFTGSLVGSAGLQIIDEDDEVLDTIVFTSPISGVWEATFIPEDHSITNQKVKLKIVALEYENFINNPTFLTSLSPWLQTATAANDWSFDTNRAKVTIPPAGFSEKLYQAHSKLAGNYKLRAEATMTDGVNEDAQVDVYLRFYDGGTGGTLVKQQLLGTLAGLSVGDNYTITYDAVINVPADFDTVSLECSGYIGPLDTAIVFVDYSYVETETEVIANSDLLNIKVTHVNTKLIQYSNETDFDDLIYEDIEPTPHFNIRVKAKFFWPRNPEENESENLSTGEVVKLLGTVKKQKLLQIELAPPYMHTKLIFILQHNTIFIDNLAWKKEESYEKEDPDEHSAFSLGKTYLTQQNNSYVMNPFS